FVLTLLLFFFFQAEDGIRDRNVTGVQTCALPISWPSAAAPSKCRRAAASAAATRSKLVLRDTSARKERFSTVMFPLALDRAVGPSRSRAARDQPLCRVGGCSCVRPPCSDSMGLSARDRLRFGNELLGSFLRCELLEQDLFVDAFQQVGYLTGTGRRGDGAVDEVWSDVLDELGGLLLIFVEIV